MTIKCFLLIRNGFTRRSLRRFDGKSEGRDHCPSSRLGYHNAEVPIDRGLMGEASTTIDAYLDKTDPRWPKQCSCGYIFNPEDEWQLFIKNEYQRADTGELYTLFDAPVGAIWEADWYEDIKSMCGVDGKAYICKTPGGDWHIDGRASNCGLPNDDVHKCWCRHGEAPDFTVNKVGNTCNAGGGSIGQRDYHGVLINGELIQS